MSSTLPDGGRWKATARVAGIPSQERNPFLCGGCDLQFESDLDQMWGVRRQKEKPDQDQAVPAPKSDGWLLHLRR